MTNVTTIRNLRMDHSNPTQTLAYLLSVCFEVAEESEGATPETWEPCEDDIEYCADAFSRHFPGRTPSAQQWRDAAAMLGVHAQAGRLEAVTC